MVRLLSLQVRCSRGRPLKDVKVLLAQQVYSDTGVDEAALAPNDTEVLFKGQVRLCLCVFFFPFELHQNAFHCSFSRP